MFLNEFTDLVFDLHGSNLSIHGVSPPGVGKSTGVMQTASRIAVASATKLYDTRDRLPPDSAGKLTVIHHRIAGTYDAPDVRGFNMPESDKGGPDRAPILRSRYTWPDIFPAPEVLARASDVILFIDELMQADHDVIKPLANVLWEHAIGDFKLRNYVHPDCRVTVIAASNRMEDRSGVVKELAFVTNRLGVYGIEFSLEGYLGFLDANGYPAIARAFAAKHPQLFASAVPDKPGPFTTPRSMCNAFHGLRRLHLLADQRSGGKVPEAKFLSELPAVAREMMAGFTGEGTAQQFAAFAKLAGELPEQEDIEKNPKGCKVPGKLDAQYVTAIYVARWLAERARKYKGSDPEKGSGLVGQYLTYLSRLPQDLQVAAVTTATATAPLEIANTKSFVQWARDNGDILVAAKAGAA